MNLSNRIVLGLLTICCLSLVAYRYLPDLMFVTSLHRSGGMERNFAVCSAEPRARVKSPIFDRKCSVLRYTAPGCPFCKMDASSWAQVERQGEAHQCRIVLIFPSVRDQQQEQLETAAFSKTQSSSHEHQACFVSAIVAKYLALRATPSTYVFNSVDFLTWARVGLLQGHSPF